MSRIPSPQTGRRACLCDDGTYSINCCKGNLSQQGIGNITKTSVSRFFKVTSCVDNTVKHIHTQDLSLTVNNVYYLKFVHHHNSGCYTITATRNSGHLDISSATASNNCTACIAAN